MHAKPDLRVFLKWMINRSGSVITAVITFHARSGWWDAQSVQHQTRDMLVHRDSRFVRCPLWFVTCLPVIDTNTEVLDKQTRDATTTGCNR